MRVCRPVQAVMGSSSHAVLGQHSCSEAAASSPPAAPPASPKQPQGLVHTRVDHIPGYLGSFTVAGVVDAPPERVFRILSSPAEFPKVYSACMSVDEIRQEAAAPEAGGLPALTFVMRNMVTVLGLTLSPAMRLRLQPDAARGEVRFSQLEPAGMVSSMEGVNAVLPLPDGAGLARADLAAQLAGTTEAFLRVQGIAAEPAQGAEPPLASVSHGLLAPLLRVPRCLAPPSCGATDQESCPQRSIVIMHQRVKLKFLPPGASVLAKDQMLSLHTRNLSDLLCRLGSGTDGRAAAPQSRGLEEVEARA